MRKDNDNSQTDSVSGFLKVMGILTFKRRQRKKARRTSWEQTHWGRKFMESM